MVHYFKERKNVRVMKEKGNLEGREEKKVEEVAPKRRKVGVGEE